ncbi:DUF6544 family protein [Stomatohabitans albus]|uniref:DUF6544 family protein n=1 Tax=Stomatohabitans albus TaxID=3110766 RepID=UPI00300C303B
MKISSLFAPLHNRIAKWVRRVLLGVGLVSIIQILPWSPTLWWARRNDNRIISREPLANRGADRISEADLRNLPDPIRRYIETVGWIGRPRPSFMRITTQASRMLVAGFPSPVAMRFTQLNAAASPERQRVARGRTAGLALEAVDAFVNGTDTLQVVSARLVPLLRRAGRDMDASGLAAWIAEAILIPGALLERGDHNHTIIWTPIDDKSAGITVKAFGLTVDGVFTINGDGLVHSFTTDGRPWVHGRRHYRPAGWTMTYDSWVDTAGGKLPTMLKTFWHVDGKDTQGLISKNATITFW